MVYSMQKKAKKDALRKAGQLEKETGAEPFASVERLKEDDEHFLKDSEHAKELLKPLEKRRRFKPLSKK